MLASIRFIVIVMAATAIAAPSSAWSKQARHTARQHMRAAAPQSRSYGANPKEPFTAEEKRRFQEPTGHEVDRW